MDNMPSSAPPPIPSYPPQQTGNWWQRNWKWFVPTGCASLLALVALFAGGIVLVVFSAMKATDVYKTTVNRAETNEQVLNALGRPVKPGTSLSGSVHVSGQSGDADFSIPLSGPSGKGTIYVTATKSEGVWSYSKMEVRVDGTGEVIDLRAPTP